MAALASQDTRAISAAERTMLRKLHAYGPAVNIGFRKGWMLNGTRYTDRALYRLIDVGLARCWKDPDGVKIGCTPIGRDEAERTPRSKPVRVPPEDTPPAAARSWWLDD